MSTQDQDKWDRRFLALAEHIAQWSKDPSTKVGAVIVDEDRRIVSVGYNGFAAGVHDYDGRLEDRELKYKFVIHAERNAILFARRELTGCTLYTTPFPPCAQCAAMLVQLKFARVVSFENHLYHERWAEDFVLAEKMYGEASVQFLWLRK